MMEKKTVTVIVPVYNVEDYLRKCVDSLLAQTFKDFDVVLVDDGSTDSSGRLCDEIACGHDFIKTVHKQNGGLSDARNAGYPYITGDYVLFLDSDDYLAPNALELLYGFAKSEDCDIVQGGFYYAYEDRLMYDNRWFEPDSKAFVLVRQKAMKELVKNNFLKNFAWGKLYRSDIVKQFLFPKGRYFEDSYWQHLVVDKAERIGFVPAPVLYYLQRGGSISGSFNGKSIDLLYGLEERLSFIREHYPELAPLMKGELVKAIGLHYTQALQSPDARIRETFSRYLEEAKDRIGIGTLDLFLIRHGRLRNILRLPQRIAGRLFGKKPIIIQQGK